MSLLLVILHVIVAVALILVVLLQTGKGASMGAAFGGGSSGTVFGSRGPASFMSKMTAVAAIVFMLTSLGLSIFKGNPIAGDSVMQNLTPAAQEESAPQNTAPASEPDVPPVPEMPKDEAQPIGSQGNGN